MKIVWKVSIPRDLSNAPNINKPIIFVLTRIQENPKFYARRLLNHEFYWFRQTWCSSNLVLNGCIWLDLSIAAKIIRSETIIHNKNQFSLLAQIEVRQKRQKGFANGVIRENNWCYHFETSIRIVTMDQKLNDNQYFMGQSWESSMWKVLLARLSLCFQDLTILKWMFTILL